MSKYTTEVRFICETLSGLSESEGYNSIAEIVSKSREKIFDFDYPIFDTNYKATLEEKILKHYYTREIGEETVGLWKLRLNAKLNEIMPYYNQLYASEKLKYEPLATHDIKTEHEASGKSDTNGSSNSNGNTTSNGINYNLYSDTPQGSLNGLDGIDEGGETKSYFLTNASKNIDSNQGTSNSNASNDSHTTAEDSYWTTVKGFMGVNGSDLLMKYRQTFLNIDVSIINDLEPLFMQLW